MKQAANAPKELTGKPQVGAGVAQELESPPPIAPIPMPPDNLPAPSVSGPSSPDAGSRIKIESKPVEVGPPPRIAKPDELPPSASESGPPARIVPVSPTTQAPTTSVVTPVLKKQSAVTKAKVLPLTGTHRCTLDAKNGLTLPKAVREQMGEQDTLFITLGSDHCVWLTTAAGLEKLTDRLEKSPAVEDDAKVARRRYFAQTERVTVDKNGYVVVPAALLESAGLKQDAVLIGVGDHLELWDTQRWHKYSQTPGNEPDASAERHDEL
jgi:MraZ protein